PEGSVHRKRAGVFAVRPRLREREWDEKIRVGEEIEVPRKDADDAKGCAVRGDRLSNYAVGRCIPGPPQTVTDRDDRLALGRELRRSKGAATLRVERARYASSD